METSEKKLTMGGAQTLYNDLRKRAASADENLAPYYDATQTYAVGDMVMYKDNLYECSTAIATAEIWTAAHWTQRSVSDVLNSLVEDVDDLNSAINDAPTEAMGAELLNAEIAETELLYELLYKLTELPADEMLADIRDELIAENEWLEIIRAEIDERLTEVA